MPIKLAIGSTVYSGTILREINSDGFFHVFVKKKKKKKKKENNMLIVFLHRCKTPRTSVLDMIFKHLTGKCQFGSFGKYGLPLHCHNYLVHSDPGLVVPVRVRSMCQIETLNHLLNIYGTWKVCWLFVLFVYCWLFVGLWVDFVVFGI